MGNSSRTCNYVREYGHTMLTCKECGEMYLRNFIPAVCAKCGIPLTDEPGRGFEPLFELFELIDLTVPAFRCRHCGRRIHEQAKTTQCCYCHRDISDMTRWSRRMFLRVWRRICIYWRFHGWPRRRRISSP